MDLDSDPGTFSLLTSQLLAEFEFDDVHSKVKGLGRVA